MFEFITQYKLRTVALVGEIPLLVRLFYCVGLVRAYVYMVQTFVERSKSNPEIARTPAMFDAMIEHFQTYPLDHIDMNKAQIFSDEFVGTLSHLEDWQEAGYPLERSDENYDRRVKIWRAIWNGTPITEKITYTTKSGKTITKNWTFTPKTKSEPHENAAIDATMEARMSNYSETVRYIPFWLPLNNGTGEIGGNPGYPVVEGMKFVDIAEQRIPEYTKQMLNMLDFYLVEHMSAVDDHPALSLAIPWLKLKLKYTDTYDLDIFAIAEKLALA